MKFIGVSPDIFIHIFLNLFLPFSLETFRLHSFWFEESHRERISVLRDVCISCNNASCEGLWKCCYTRLWPEDVGAEKGGSSRESECERHPRTKMWIDLLIFPIPAMAGGSADEGWKECNSEAWKKNTAKSWGNHGKTPSYLSVFFSFVSFSFYIPRRYRCSWGL